MSDKQTTVGWWPVDGPEFIGEAGVGMTIYDSRTDASYWMCWDEVVGLRDWLAELIARVNQGRVATCGR